ncbi:hypothetical protein F5X68DRAFT_204846, partial [Plectosphaerella plurivora]
MAAVAPRGLPHNANLPAKVTSIPPNQTLYVTNLPSAKIQKEDLRTELYMLFSTYGPVLDIVAMKTMKMRGQAHITFRDVQTSTQAMRSLEGFEFLGRQLKISYAKSKSNHVAKLDGTFKMAGGAAEVEVTSLQQRIFNAPTSGAPAAAPAAGAPAPAKSAGDQTMRDTASPDTRGQKRQRDDEDDSDSDVAMEEDSDD